MKTFNPYLRGLGQMDVGALVDSVAGATAAVETTEIEWKREWSLDTRPRRAALARHIIGFSNRDPDQASRVFGGHAFLLIGVEPGGWGYGPDIDPADLVQQLEPFTGSDLPWHPVYVDRSGHRVLVIVVDPPQWGDPVRRILRGSKDPDTGKEIVAGTPFVRRPGMTIAADATQLERLEKRAHIPQPRLRVVSDWNLGSHGNYIAVNVVNEAHGREATIREIGFTVSATATVEQLPDRSPVPGEPHSAIAYTSLPIPMTERPIAAGQILRFRVPLGRLPFFWDDDTAIYPYAYFDEGHWLVGEASPIAGHLRSLGWTGMSMPPTFPILTMDYVWPESVSGLRSRFDLTTHDE